MKHVALALLLVFASCTTTSYDDTRLDHVMIGVSDLETFTLRTHKYERHYTSHLVAPWPERRDLYRARSPLHAANRIAKPLLVAQGLDDHVVLPEQATGIVEALRARKVPVVYLEFEGEGHGFVRSETLVSCLESSLAFVARVFGIES